MKLYLAFQSLLFGRLERLIEVKTFAPIMWYIVSRQGFFRTAFPPYPPLNSIPICSEKDPPLTPS
jgi:hypothetical protein